MRQKIADTVTFQIVDISRQPSVICSLKSTVFVSGVDPSSSRRPIGLFCGECGITASGFGFASGTDADVTTGATGL